MSNRAIVVHNFMIECHPYIIFFWREGYNTRIFFHCLPQDYCTLRNTYKHSYQKKRQTNNPNYVFGWVPPAKIHLTPNALPSSVASQKRPQQPLIPHLRPLYSAVKFVNEDKKFTRSPFYSLNIKNLTFTSVRMTLSFLRQLTEPKIFN